MSKDKPTDPKKKSRRSDLVYQQLCKEITDGKILPGTQLREQEICDRLGISRTPVREALNRLTVDGLAQSVPNAGVYVKVFSAQDLEDMYRLRAALESMAARMACERGFSSEKLDRMREAQRIFTQGIRENQHELVAHGDVEFHKLLIALPESRILQEVLAKNNVHIFGWRSIGNLAKRPRLKQVVKEHDLILKALAKCDADLAARYCEQHILTTSRNIQEVLGTGEENSLANLKIMGGLR